MSIGTTQGNSYIGTHQPAMKPSKHDWLTKDAGAWVSYLTDNAFELSGS